MTNKIHKSPEAWRAQLGEGLTYQVTREKATERPFTGRYWDDWRPGVYHCICCGAPLFDAENKFDAGCGWPSFDRTLNDENIENVRDESYGMIRTEVLCRACGAHLGHVFNDGPTSTGERYCINSAAIKHTEDE